MESPDRDARRSERAAAVRASYTRPERASRTAAASGYPEERGSWNDVENGGAAAAAATTTTRRARRSAALDADDADVTAPRTSRRDRRGGGVVSTGSSLLSERRAARHPAAGTDGDGSGAVAPRSRTALSHEVESIEDAPLNGDGGAADVVAASRREARSARLAAAGGGGGGGSHSPVDDAAGVEARRRYLDIEPGGRRRRNAPL